MSLLEEIERCIKYFDEISSANLISYIALRGSSILELKARGEAEFAKEKENLIEDVCTKFTVKPDHIGRMIDEWSRALVANGYHVKVCEVEAVSRVIVGVSEVFGQVPFEVGLFFDPVLNVPYIPGSSLKGALRHALEDLVRVKHVGNAEELVSTVFGSEKVAGLVGVSDAYPVSLGVNGRLFEPDVVTPHYPSAMTELDVKPNPVPFLTIAPGVRFRFLVFFNKEIYSYEHDRRAEKDRRRRIAKLGIVSSEELRSTRTEENIEDILRYAVHYDDKDLGEAIKEKGLKSVNAVPWVDIAVLYAFARGVGAKTSLGYSRFKLIQYKALKEGES